MPLTNAVCSARTASRPLLATLAAGVLCGPAAGQSTLNEWVGGPIGTWERANAWSLGEIPTFGHFATINDAQGVVASSRIQIEGLSIAAADDENDPRQFNMTLLIDDLLPPIPPVSVLGRFVVVGSAGEGGAATGTLTVADGLYIREITSTESRNLVIAEARGDDAYAFGSMTVNDNLSVEGQTHVASLNAPTSGGLVDARVYGSLEVFGDFTAFRPVMIGSGRGDRIGSAELFVGGDLIAENQSLAVGAWRYADRGRDTLNATASASVLGDVYGAAKVGSMTGGLAYPDHAATTQADLTIGGALIGGGITVGIHDHDSVLDSTTATAVIGGGIHGGGGIFVGGGGATIDASLTIESGGAEVFGDITVGNASGLGDIDARAHIVGDVLARSGFHIGTSVAPVRSLCDAELTIEGSFTTGGYPAEFDLGTTWYSGMTDATVHIAGTADFSGQSKLRLARAFHESTAAGVLLVMGGDLTGVRIGEIALSLGEETAAEGTLTVLGDYTTTDDDATLEIAAAGRPNATALGVVRVEGSVGYVDELVLASCVGTAPAQRTVTGRIEVVGGTLDTGRILCGTASQVGDLCEGFITVSNGLLSNRHQLDLRAGSLKLDRSVMQTGAFALHEHATLVIHADRDLMEMGGPVIDVVDSVTLGGRLDFRVDPTAPPAEEGATITLLRFNGSRTGTFDGLPEGASIGHAGRLKWELSYAGGDGNDIVVVATPFGCSDADLVAPFGLVDLADIVEFVNAFVAGDPQADLGNDGITDASDLIAFITAASTPCD